MNSRSLLRSVLFCLAVCLIVGLPGSCSASDLLPNTSNTSGTATGDFDIRPDIDIAALRGGTPPEGFVSTAGGPIWDGDHSHPDPELIDHIYRDLDARLGTNSSRSRLSVPSGWRGGLPSKGTVRVPVILVDFADAPHLSSQTASDVQSKMFGAGNANLYPVESLRNYYQRSSYNQLTIQGDVYGWYRSPWTRAQYEQSARNYEARYAAQYGAGIGLHCARSDFVNEVLQGIDSQVDFSKYDNDNDGVLDGVYVKFAGGAEQGSLWWAWQFSNVWNFSVDGKKVNKYVTSFYADPDWDIDNVYPHYSPRFDIHETGHLLGLPDYYDYDLSVGPKGHVGGWDMMGGNWGDHNAFSKYLLGWITPTIVAEGSRVIDLQPASMSKNAVLIMPGASLNTYSEFFMAEYREPKKGNDPGIVWAYPGGRYAGPVSYTTKGLFIWHVDARLNSQGTNFAYDNSYTAHKLLRFMEADGQEHLERGTVDLASYYDQNDIYTPSRSLGPTTVPNSNSYAGQRTNVVIDQIQLTSTGARARFAVTTSTLTAAFTAASTSGTAPLTVQFTDTSTGSPTSWSWTFGDGTTSTLQNPSHTYATTGTYTVTLTVRNAAGQSNSKVATGMITVGQISSDPWYKPHVLPCTVETEDYDITGTGNAYSDTTAANEGGAYRSDAVDIERLATGGHVVCYVREGEWTRYTVESPTAATYPVSFRVSRWLDPARTIEVSVDSTPQATITVPKTASSSIFSTVSTSLAIPAGRHTITLKYHGGSMNLDSFTVGSLSQPTGLASGFTASPTSGTVPLSVQFTDTSTGSPTSWTWTFGDGTTSTLQNPSHTYATTGTYAVSLTVRNAAGQSNTKTQAGMITVGQVSSAPWYRPHVLPCTVEAEDYDITGAGTAFFDTTTANEGRAYRTDAVDIESISGGYGLCYVREGEWTKYTVESPTTATYPVTLRVGTWTASPARTIEVQVDGVTQRTVTVPNTRSSSAFATVATQLTVPAGRHMVTLKYHGGSMNIDWFGIGN